MSNSTLQQIELVRADQNGVEFYTEVGTSETGMSQSGLAILCGVSSQAILDLEKTLSSRAPSKSLEPFVGEGLTLSSSRQPIVVNGKSAGNLKIYKSAFCARVIQHYAYKGNEVAQYSLDQFSDRGITSWIHEITGYNPLPKKKSELYRLAAEQEERLEQQQLLIAQQLEQIKTDQPKVEMYDRVMDANGLHSIADVAKMSKCIGELKLFAFLREHKVFFYDGRKKNMPMQKYVDCGYFQLKEIIIEPKGFVTHQIFATEAGKEYIFKLLKRENIMQPVAV